MTRQNLAAPGAIQIVDLYHALERLAEVGKTGRKAASGSNGLSLAESRSSMVMDVVDSQGSERDHLASLLPVERSVGRLLGRSPRRIAFTM